MCTGGNLIQAQRNDTIGDSGPAGRYLPDVIGAPSRQTTPVKNQAETGQVVTASTQVGPQMPATQPVKASQLTPVVNQREVAYPVGAHFALDAAGGGGQNGSHATTDLDAELDGQTVWPVVEFHSGAYWCSPSCWPKRSGDTLV